MSNIEYFLNLYTLNMRNNKLYNNLINDIAKSVKHAINESYTIDTKANYKLKVYDPINNIEDKNFISDNKDMLWNFFNDGYRAASVGDFLSCLNSKSLKKNTNLMKLAYIDNNIIAASIYSGRNGGYKCVGITATTNPEYRDIGKHAAKDIIKYDMEHYDEFYWIMCDKHIKYMCEHRNGIPIPNEYAHIIDERLIPDMNDDYRMFIKLADDEKYEKYIFGFNSKELVQEIINKQDKRLLLYINKINKLNEAIETYQIDIYDKASKIINMLYDERCEVSGCFSENILSILKDNIITLEDYISKNPQDSRYERFILDIENGHDILNSSTELKINKL